VRKRELTVITGYPNHGKSVWLDNLLVNLARREDWRVGIFSAENVPVSRHVASLSEIYLGKPFSKGVVPRMSESEMRYALSWLNRRFRFINPVLEERSVDNLLEVASRMCGCGRSHATKSESFSCVDPSHLIVIGNERRQSKVSR